MSTKISTKKDQPVATATSNASQPANSDTQKPAPTPMPVKVYKTQTSTMTFPEERTAKIILPETLFLEADPVTVAKRKGHQIDPSRPASHIGVMPNLDLLKATGNPYPNDPAHPTVVTGEVWKPYISAAYHTYAMLKEKNEVAPSSIYVEVQQRVGGEKLTYIQPAVRDALRDLACVGLAEAFTLGMRKFYRLKAS